MIDWLIYFIIATSIGFGVLGIAIAIYLFRDWYDKDIERRVEGYKQDFRIRLIYSCKRHAPEMSNEEIIEFVDKELKEDSGWKFGEGSP